MSYHVRLMRREDSAQVTDIDREAFPTQWPSPNYQRELQNRLAHYIVAYDDEKIMDNSRAEIPSAKGPDGLIARFRRLFGRNHTSNNTNEEALLSNEQFVVGFAGFWVMVDEAHITSIAVREAYRRRGIGELLLMSVIDLAAEQKAHTVTLEVRVSNTGAQSLYTKYGFNEVGTRRGYYTDNREDALLMTTDDINSAAFRARFRQLKQAHSRKPGITLS